MPGDTQPLKATVNQSNPLPPDLFKYEEKIKARLAAALIAVFVYIITIWTFRKPNLSDQMVGAVLGSLFTVLTALVNSYWNQGKSTVQVNQNSDSA